MNSGKFSRIIVDVVMNHMVGVSQKSGENGRSGSAGSSFDGTDGVEDFPEVGAALFKCDNSHIAHSYVSYRCLIQNPISTTIAATETFRDQTTSTMQKRSGMAKKAFRFAISSSL